MTPEEMLLEKTLISSKIKNDLEQLNFVLSQTPETGVMWGFDGKTEHFPRETFIREAKDGKPTIKLRVEKTLNGLILVINSIPFKSQNHLDRAQLNIEEVIPILKEYLSLI